MSTRLVYCLAVWTLFLVGSPIARAQDDETEVRNPLTSEKSCAELGSTVEAGADVYGSALVCAASRVTANSWNPNGPQCSTEVSFEAAVEMCTLIGARLCTSEELANDEARNSGCAADLARVWTGTDWDCPVNFSTTQAGSSEYLGLHPAECTQKSDTAYVRCCADVCPDICALDPCGDAANTCTAIITPGSAPDDLRRQAYSTRVLPSTGLSSTGYSTGTGNYLVNTGTTGTTASYSIPTAYSTIPNTAYSYNAYPSSSIANSYAPSYTYFPSSSTVPAAIMVAQGTNQIQQIQPQCLETYTCECGEDYELFQDDATNTCKSTIVPTTDSPTVATTAAPTVATTAAPTVAPRIPIPSTPYPISYNPYPISYNPYPISYNTGSYNTGSYNFNTYPNTGSYNFNTYPNTGSYINTYPNTGSYNFNTYPNTGSYNTGSYNFNTYPNTGSYNTGSYNFNTYPNTGSYYTYPNTGLSYNSYNPSTISNNQLFPSLG